MQESETHFKRQASTRDSIVELCRDHRVCAILTMRGLTRNQLKVLANVGRDLTIRHFVMPSMTMASPGGSVKRMASLESPACTSVPLLSALSIIGLSIT